MESNLTNIGVFGLDINEIKANFQSIAKNYALSDDQVMNLLTAAFTQEKIIFSGKPRKRRNRGGRKKTSDTLLKKANLTRCDLQIPSLEQMLIDHFVKGMKYILSLTLSTKNIFCQINLLSILYYCLLLIKKLLYGI